MYNLASLEDYQDFYDWQDELFDELSLEAGFETAPVAAVDLWDLQDEPDDVGLDKLTLSALLVSQRGIIEEQQMKMDELEVRLNHQQSLLSRMFQVLPKAIRQGLEADLRAEYAQEQRQERLAAGVTVNVDSDDDDADGKILQLKPRRAVVQNY
jgi:hypothetical protein